MALKKYGGDGGMSTKAKMIGIILCLIIGVAIGYIGMGL